MTLELNKLTGQVAAMGEAMATREQQHVSQVRLALEALARNAEVTEELHHKIARACAEDSSWRGARPIGGRLDERHAPSDPAVPATLIAVDGSQIYLDRHGIATYYLLNTGSMVMRQGSGEAPATASKPEVFFDDDHLYDEAGRLRDADFINSERDRREIETLADLVEAEREALGGDLSQPIVALMDGPLLLWSPLRVTENEIRREVAHFTRQLDRLKRARAVPIGYVDRPDSANVLRTVELADLPLEEITRERLRTGPFRAITDRLLFAGLAPNERTGFFASTSELNDRYRAAGHHILFCYVNMARQPGSSMIARMEIPEWLLRDVELLDTAQSAIFGNCQPDSYPYVLARAHELALVTHAEHEDFEGMLMQAMLSNGLIPQTSQKELYKRWMRAAQRR